MMVMVLGGKLAAGKGINALDAGNHLHRKGEGRLPASLGTLLVLKVEAGGRCILDASRSAHVVVDRMKQVGLDATGQVEELIGTIPECGVIVRPQDPLCPCTIH